MQKALEWYLRSADAGYPHGVYNLGDTHVHACVCSTLLD
jgi:TPR repeat protein